MLALTAAGLSGCGGSTRPRTSTVGARRARSLVRQSFAARHLVHSGVVSLVLTVLPRGSSELTRPFTLTVAGPFDAEANGRLPAFDLALDASIQGHHGHLEVISSASGAAYVTLAGHSYRMPPSLYRGVGEVFGSLVTGTSTESGPGGAHLLSSMGVDPITWLSDLRIAGTGTIGGTTVTHVRARLGVGRLLTGLSKLLSVAVQGSSTLAQVLPAGIPPDTRAQIRRAIKRPSFDLWTGTADRIIRRLSVGASIPVSGSARVLLGGLRSADVEITLDYDDVNKPQAVVAPTDAGSYRQFRRRLRGLALKLSREFSASGLLAPAPVPASPTAAGQAPATGATARQATATGTAAGRAPAPTSAGRP